MTLNMRKEFVRSRVTSRRIDTGNAERLVLKKTTVVNHFTNGQETNEGVKAKYSRKSARNPGTQHNKRSFVDENHRAHSSADKQKQEPLHNTRMLVRITHTMNVDNDKGYNHGYERKQN